MHSPANYSIYQRCDVLSNWLMCFQWWALHYANRPDVNARQLLCHLLYVLQKLQLGNIVLFCSKLWSSVMGWIANLPPNSRCLISFLLRTCTVLDGLHAAWLTLKFGWIWFWLDQYFLFSREKTGRPAPLQFWERKRGDCSWAQRRGTRREGA